MPWTSVPTFTSGQVLTAAQMNGIGGNLNALRGDFGLFRRTSGNVALTGTTTWSDLTTIGTGGDITMAASSGDLIEASLFALLNSDAVDMAFDVNTVVSSVKTNSLTTGGTRPTAFTAFNSSGWYVPASRIEALTGSVFYVLQSGDVSGGNVTLRVQYAMNTATNRTLFGTTANPFQWYARNHGPVEI